MVVVQMPLYSHQAWGKFYGVFEGDAPHPVNTHNPLMCIYQRRHYNGKTIVVKEKYYVPTYSLTPAQADRRNLFADGVSRWQGMSAAEKNIFKIYGAPFSLPGYQKFLSLFLNKKIT